MTDSKLYKTIGSDNPAVYKQPGDVLDANGMPRCRRCGDPAAKYLASIGRYVARRGCSCRCNRASTIIDVAAKLKLEENDRRMREISIADHRHYLATFDRFICRDARDERLLAILKAYVADWKTSQTTQKGFLLYGPVGTGKTFAACCVANALRDKGVTSCIVNVGRMIHFNAQEFEDHLKMIRNPDFLLLDDLGSERQTEYVTNRLLQIVDARYNSLKPMWVTTNYANSKKMNSVQQQRIWSRIAEETKQLKIDGQDRRIFNAARS